MPRLAIGDSSYLHYERCGSGPPVFLISGLRGLAAHWRHQVPALSAAYTVIVHDQRGTGQSDQAPTSYSVEQMAGDVVALMDALDVGSAHFIGHSTGAAIAQVLALDFPERVQSLVLVSGWPRPDTYFRLTFELRLEMLKALGAAAFERYSTLFVNPPWYVNAHAAEARSADAQPPLAATAGRIAAILAFDRHDQLPNIKAPTLVICSEDDRLTPLYFSQQLAHAIPGARLTVMHGAGHSCHQTKPDSFNEIILPFLGEVEISN